MKRLWIYGLTGLLFLFVSGQTAQEAYEVESFVGNVQFSVDGRNWKAVDIGMRLSQKSWIRTGDDSTVVMMYQNRRSLQLLQNTVVQLRNLGRSETVSVQRGRVHLNVFRRLRRGEVVQVENDVAVAAVRGTRFIIDYEEGKAVTCSVVEGTVTLTRQVKLPPEVARDPEIERLLTVQVRANQQLSMTMDENRALEATIQRSKNNLAVLRSALSQSQRETMARVMAIENVRRVLDELHRFDEEQGGGAGDADATVERMRQR